jgi:hypothetical protein
VPVFSRDHRALISLLELYIALNDGSILVNFDHYDANNASPCRVRFEDGNIIL